MRDAVGRLFKVGCLFSQAADAVAVKTLDVTRSPAESGDLTAAIVKRDCWVEEYKSLSDNYQKLQNSMAGNNEEIEKLKSELDAKTREVEKHDACTKEVLSCL